MTSRPLPQPAESLYAAYVEELREFFATSRLACGTPECIFDISERLRTSTAFFEDLSSLVRSFILRQGGSMPHAELLQILALAVGGPEMEQAPQVYRQPLRHLLSFVTGILRRPWDQPPGERAEVFPFPSVAAAPAPAARFASEEPAPGLQEQDGLASPDSFVVQPPLRIVEVHLAPPNPWPEPQPADPETGGTQEFCEAGSLPPEPLIQQPADAAESTPLAADDAGSFDPPLLRFLALKAPVVLASRDVMLVGSAAAVFAMLLVIALHHYSSIPHDPPPAVAKTPPAAEPAQAQAAETYTFEPVTPAEPAQAPTVDPAPPANSAQAPSDPAPPAKPAAEPAQAPTVVPVSPAKPAAAGDPSTSAPTPAKHTRSSNHDGYIAPPSFHSYLNPERPSAAPGPATPAGAPAQKLASPGLPSVSRPSSATPRLSGVTAAFAQPGPSLPTAHPEPGAAARIVSENTGKSSVREPSSSPALADHPAYIDVSSGVMANNLISAPMPVYPSFARMTHVQGEVILQTVISPDGSVSAVRVVSGPRLLRGAAVGAVRRWRYRPYVVEGRPVDVSTIVTLSFHAEHRADSPSPVEAAVAASDPR